jgi:hypothetical protein
MEPEVVVYLASADRYPNVLNLVITNIGKGPARHLRLQHDGTPEEFQRHKVRIENVKLFEGWSVLPQGERLEFLFGVAPDLLKAPALRPLTFTVEYEDLNGRARRSSQLVNVSSFKGWITVGHPPEHEMAEALKKIESAVSAWSSGFKRLKVETITTAELEARDQKMLGEWEQ